MSIWTHVTGCIRIDAFTSLMYKPVESIIAQAFGKMCKFDDGEDAWNSCNVPCGSEGSVRWNSVCTQEHNSLSWGLVYIWGDLRDYSSASEIAAWLNKAKEHLYKNAVGIRGLSVCIEVEGGKKCSLTIDDNGEIITTDIADLNAGEK